MFFRVELCGVVRYHMVWHCMVWFCMTLNGGATQLFTRLHSFGCENNGQRNRTMTMELPVIENH